MAPTIKYRLAADMGDKSSVVGVSSLSLSCLQLAAVQYILDTVVQALAANPDRKFVYGEMVSWPRIASTSLPYMLATDLPSLWLLTLNLTQLA